MKKSLRIISLILAVVMLTPCVSASAQKVDNYKINNPYETVDFENWKAYKTQLHCHTNASDGYLTVKELVQASYDLGYDVLAITDHGTNNRGWNKQPELIPIIRLIKYERTKLAPIEPLSDTEYYMFLNGTAKTTNGTVRENGMIDVPLGNELNFATPFADCHLTGYFSEYGQGLMGVFGDYETPTKGVKDTGGISMLSHIGEYVYIDKDSADHVSQPVDEYYVNKFARLFLDNAGSSVGMGINSASDAHTRCDRILYDQILKKTLPNGVTPWGFTFSDSHSFGSVNDAYTMHYMPELNNDELRKSMETGTFFSVSHYSNGYELNGMREMPEDYPIDVDIDTSLATPLVTNVVVDDEENTITMEGEEFDTITWIADGHVIKRGGMDSLSIDLDDYDIDYFVRFYITGPGGICYSQPFAAHESSEMEPVDVPETHDISTFLRGLVTVIDKLVFEHSIFIRIFKKIAMGY